MVEFVIGDRVYINAPNTKSHHKIGTVSNIVYLFGQNMGNSSNITVALDNSHYTVDVNCFSGIGIEHIDADKTFK
jgi:hypothetical protein